MINTHIKTTHFKNCLGVFQGGGAKAIAFIGAYEQARKNGVFFSELAGTSAGSLFAALIAAGATPEYLSKLVSETNFQQFNAPKDKSISDKYGTKLSIYKRLVPSKYKFLVDFIENLGVYSSEQLEVWLNEKLSELLGMEGREVTFNDLRLPLHVVGTDLTNQNQITWSSETTPHHKVAHAVRCSCTIPVYFQPVDMQYVDGGLVSSLPTFSLSKRGHYDKVLCFTLSERRPKAQCLKSYLLNLAGAVIDGAVSIQEELQSNTYYIEIQNLDVGTTDFEKLSKKLIDSSINKGREAASKFFEHETINISNRQFKSERYSRDQILNFVVLEEAQNHEQVFISLQNTRLVYSLFPTIFDWVNNKLDITFITKTVEQTIAHLEPDKKSKEKPHEEYRRFLLKKFGIRLIELEEIPFSGFLFRSDAGDYDKSILLYEDEDQIKKVGNGVIYHPNQDTYAHKSLFESLTKDFDVNGSVAKTPSFKIESVSAGKITRALKNVKQYKPNKVHVQFKNVEIQKISSITKYVKSYKYFQIEKFIKTLSKAGIDLFEACAIKFEDDTEFLITPPVIEKFSEEYRLIEGNSRLIYCFRELELDSIQSIVVEHVSVNLPSSDSFSLSEVIVTSKDLIGKDRYTGFNFEAFRYIEEAVRPPKIYVGKI